MTISAVSARNFGLIQEYNERRNKKLINNLLCTEEPKFWVTSSRPSNFGDPIDTKTKVDNWFDENRYESFNSNSSIGFGTRRARTTKSRELRCTWFRVSSSAATCLELRAS